jgi:phosphatidate cytidylyltransferase
LPVLGLTIPIIFYNNSKKYNINDALYVLGAVFFLGFAFAAIINLCNSNIWKCIYIFLISFITDTYAFIAGNLIGKHNISTISPKKTWEGSIVGSIMGCIIGSIYYYNVIGDVTILKSIILSFVLTILCEIGDLVFSSIKRYFNKKDYSNLIPGHGGILDRFDSVIFVALGFILIISIL